MAGEDTAWHPTGEGWEGAWGDIPIADVLEHQHAGLRIWLPGVRLAESPEICRHALLVNCLLTMRDCEVGFLLLVH